MWTAVLNAAQLGSGDVFLSLEPPKNLLDAKLPPSPTNIPGVIEYLKRWLNPPALARTEVQWLDWMLFVAAVQRLDGAGLLTVRVGGVEVDHAINVLEPEGTYGLPLPLPVGGLNRLLTVDGFNGWGYGEAITNPEDTADVVMQSPDLEQWAAPDGWGVNLSGARAGMSDAASFLSSPQGLVALVPEPVQDRIALASQAFGKVKQGIAFASGGASPNSEGEVLSEAIDSMVKAPFAAGVPRLMPMWADHSKADFRGSCPSSSIGPAVTQPGRCVPGDISGTPGLPTSIPIPREGLETIKRLLTCPRAAPRLTAYGGATAGTSISVLGMRQTVTLNEGVMEYRDVTGDGLPDILLQTSLGIQVLKNEDPAVGIAPPAPRGTGAVLPFMSVLSISSALNMSASTSPMQSVCNNGGGKACGNRLNVAFTSAKEGVAFTPSPSGDLTVQADVGLLTDINGDGLPDLVRSGTGLGCLGMVARLNLGGTFGGPICIPMMLDEDGNADRVDGLLGVGVSAGLSGNLNLGLSSLKGNDLGVHAAAAISRHNQHVSLTDINGDGLPDLVRRLEDRTVLVNFNLGRRFSRLVILPASSDLEEPSVAAMVDGELPMGGALNVAEPIQRLATDMRERLSRFPEVPPWLGVALQTRPLLGVLSATNAFTLSAGGGGGISGGAPVGAGVHLGVGVGQTVSWSNVQFMDIDGDGLPEPVRRVVGGRIRARLNQLGKVNRLIRVVNPLGGSISVGYSRVGNTYDMPQSRWVMSSVSVNHDVNSMETGDGAPNRQHVWAHAYEGGKWDRYNKEFLGFGRVTTSQANGEGQHRYSCTEYDVSDFHVAGKVRLQTLSTDPGCASHVLEQTKYMYHPAQIVSQLDDPVLCPVQKPLSYVAQGPSHPCSSSVVHQLEVERWSYEMHDNNLVVAAHKRERNLAYDRFGNVTLVEDQDDVDDPTDDVQVAVRYRAVGPAYLAALPEHFEVRHQGALLRSRSATYDDRGNLLEHRSWHEDGVLLTKYQFDEVGNLRQITAPTGQVIQVEYDATRTFPTEVRDDNLGLVSSQEWDVRWGKPTRTTDTNGGVMTLEYDHRGRFLSATSPLTGELVVGAGYGCLGMSGTNAARCATTLNLIEADARTARSGVMTFTAVDGMGAKRFTAKTELAPPFNTTLFGAHHVDAWGRTVRTSKPIPKSLGDVFLLIPSLGFSVPALGLPTDMPALEEATHTVLDVRDRPTQVIEPGNRVTEFIYSAWEHEGLPRQRVTTLDPDGSQTGRILDGDQLLGTVEYFDEEKSLTSYHYTVLDELFSVWHGGVPFAAMTYDALGRRTREITLDTGTRTFEYHPVTGLLTRETNGSGEAVEYFYEPRSSRMTSLTRGERRVWLRYGQGDADKVNHTVGRVKEALYDVIPPAFGTFQQSRAACINDTLCAAESYRYDALGQQVERSRALPGGETLSTVSVLDSFGRVRELTHSRGGDTVEVDYRYNSSGRVDRAEGKAHGVPRTWVTATQYDHQGRTVGIQFGNGVRKEYTYNPQTDWMTRVVACDPGFGGTSCAGSNKVYQDLALTHSPAGDIRTAATSSTRNDLLAVQAWGFEYDRRHRLTGATLTAHGWEAGHPTVDPTLTWRETWKFDRLHRLEERTTNKWSDTGAAEQRTERFAFSGLHQPRCAPLATSGADPCEETREAYDGAGRVLVLTSPTSDKRALEWTHDSMLRRVTDADGATLQENGYALAGERTTRSGTYGTYRYLGPTVTDGPSGLNAHVWVNGSRVATAFPAGTYFYISDQLGSTTMVLDKDGDVVTQVVQSPYGREIYQSAAPDWAPPAQQFLLTGKERDPETGFHAYGWRDWSSAGNHWLAPEPIWEDALQQDALGLNLYQHTRWSPVRFIDPDGRAAETPWDVANVIWDVGKVAYGAATGNPALVVEGQIDFANDLVAVAAPGYPAGGTKLARAGREVAEGVPSSAVSRVKNAATEWWAGVFNKSDVDTEMGEYAVVGGHHVFSKAVLKDAVGYSPKGGFSISQAFMKKMKWDHGEMTKVQRTMLKEMGDAGKTPTLADQTRVAFSSLVAGGASRKEARALVEQALNDLVSRGGSNGPFRNWGD